MEEERLVGKQLVEVTEVLNSLSEYGNSTSLYNIDLLNEVTAKELYVLTGNGKACLGSAIKCKDNGDKEKITSANVHVCIDEENNVFQFMLKFKDDTAVDARGYYAKHKLKIVQQRKRIK